MATAPQLAGLPEGYASLYFASAAPLPVHSTAGSRGIPLETFLLVMRHVRDGSERDLVQASHVCAGWRRAILGCGQLWRDLEDVAVADLNALDRVRAISSRAQDHLRTLALEFDLGDEMLMLSTVTVVLKQILREVSTNGARGLRELKVDLMGLRYADDLEPAYACIVLAAQPFQFAEFSAVKLRTLRILSTVDRYPAGAPFYFALPQLDKLVLTSSPTEPYGDARLPDFFSTTASLESAQITTCALTTLILSGVCLMDSMLPEFPNLRTFKLFKVRVCNLYGLLVKATQLETLWLRTVQSDPANRFLPPAADGGLKDVPPPLELPALRHLCIAGASPLLWIPPTQTTSHFVVVTPFLQTVDLGEQHNFHIDDDGEQGLYPPTSNLTKEALSTLFRNSPHLAKLNLTHHSASTDILSPALQCAPETLTTLLIGGTTFASDAFIERLGPKILPNLEWLDVFHSAGNEANKVSVQALARLAERYKKAKPLQRWLGLWSEVKLTIVANEPIMDDEPSTAELRSSLRKLLIPLSPSQVAHLPSQLSLNPPPGGLSFPVIRQELVNLPLPPPMPPYPLKPNGKSVAAGDPPAAAKKGPEAGPRAAADQSLVDDARRAMQRWHERREREWAIEWCRREEGVELRWGVGCPDEGCDCWRNHPGAAEWIKGADEDE
ncbi:hypothetical protein JCM10450v2_007127 [Rhodotorula kratochvilovae]